MFLAQKIIIPGGKEIQGPLDNRFTDLASVVNQALPIVFSIAGLILFAMLIMGGFSYLTSMGDPKKAEAGKQKITNALIGILIIFIAFWVVQLLNYLLKLGI